MTKGEDHKHEEGKTGDMKKGKTTNLTNHTNFYFGSSELNLNFPYSSGRIMGREVKYALLPLSSSVHGYLITGFAIRRGCGTVC
jgi:hypothetical protein